MVILFDKNIDDNIDTIVANNIEYNSINIMTEGSMGWLNDDTTITFIGATDVVVTFKNDGNNLIYLEQMILATSTPYSPIEQGLNTDPKYDKIPPSGHINTHTYVETDVEQDAINGD